MKSIYPLLVIAFLFASCGKWLPENRIVGSWKLVEVEKRRVFDKKTIATGYEDGTFVFADGETAQYDDAIGNMSGNWRIRSSQYGQSGNKNTFTLRLYNFNSNRVIDWEFDTIEFRKSGNRLLATMQRSGYEYRYDFRRE